MRIDSTFQCDLDELRLRLEPRDDVLVLERSSDLAGARDGTNGGPPRLPPSGVVEYELEHGPFRRYRRTLRWEPSHGEQPCAVHQSIEAQPAIPYWAPLFAPFLRRALPDGLPRGTTPWWVTPDRLSARQSTVVATMALFNFTAGLLYGLLTQVLTFVSADLGEGTPSEQTTLLAVVRVGVVVTMAAMVLADREGRRRMAIWSFATAAVLTVVTAASPSLWVVGALQLVSRNLAIAGLLCVDTIAVEEVPPGSRAMVTGLGTLAYGLGAGVVVMTLPLTDLGPWGWRATFVVAGLTLPLIWHAARHLPESGRFERVRSAAPQAQAESRRIHGRRFLLIGAMFFLLNVFVAPASQLQNDYLRSEHAFSGLLITVFVVATSTPAGLGVMLGGRLADIRGRRAAIIPGLVALGVFNAIFFAVGGPAMWVASLLGSVLGAMSVPAMGVLAPELFPTARRGGARGALTGVAVVGSVCGLLAAGAFSDSWGYGPAFALLAVAPLLAAALATTIPETRGKELEELNR